MDAMEIDLVEPILYEYFKTITNHMKADHPCESRSFFLDGINYSVEANFSHLLLQENCTGQINIPNKKRDKLFSLVRIIEEQYRHYSIDDAAKFLGYSKCHFSRYFHKTTGILFSKYLNNVKISKAIELIKENKKVNIYEIAEYCGFNNVRNFNRLFKEFTGKTPKSSKTIF